MSDEVNMQRLIEDLEIEEHISSLVQKCHKASTKAGWWNNWKHITHDSTREIVAFLEVAAKLCLIHSEISEAMEGHRTAAKDDKIPHRKMLEVELADAVIRICDIAGKLELDLGSAIAEKMRYNEQREDHKLKNREKPGGKKY